MSEEFELRRHEIVMAEFIKLKVRYISVSVLRAVLKKEMNIEGGICLWCGERLKSPYGYWCKGHGYKFWKAYTYNYIIEKYRKHHKLCEMCGERETEEIHHRTPIVAEGGGGHPLDEKNLVALCRACHLKAHKDYKVVVFHKKNPPLERYDNRRRK